MQKSTEITVAVIIPCRNEVLFIEECIDAIYSSDLPEIIQLRVFVVDGQSDDGTLDVLQTLVQKYPAVEVVNNELKLTPYAFNLGIRAGEGADYIQIIGARHIVSKDYILKCYHRLFSNKEIWCVGGRLVNEYLNQTGKTIACAMGTSFGMGLGNFRTLEKSGFTDTVTSPMYPKFVFEQIGYFDENLVRNQDDDFNFRVVRAGGLIYFDATISLKYYVRANYSGLWRQFFQYGYWKVYVNKKHRTVTTLRQLVPPLFVGYLVLWVLSLLLGWRIFTIASLPVVLYAFMAIYFSVKSAGKAGVHALSVLKTFPILHVAYGLGYLKGIGEFFILGKKPSDRQKKLSR